MLRAMTIPTEPIGSIPRPAALIDALLGVAAGTVDAARLHDIQHEALVDTIRRFEATGSPIISDGEQTKPSFATYPLAGLDNLGSEGVVIPFADGHTRRLPVLTAGPFRYATHAASYVEAARKLTDRPIKQAVISVSAMSLLYPDPALAGYPRERFLDDLVAEGEADIRGALAAGADSVQIDFTEARLSLKLDPSAGLLRSFIALNNRVLERFDTTTRTRLGVHVCPGGDHDSTHSADVDYAPLLAMLFDLEVGRFFVQLASERAPEQVLAEIARRRKPDQRVYVGVTDPIDAHVETAEQVCERVLLAARHLPIEWLGTTDDCGFAPFADDRSTARDTAFAKITARVQGTRMAAERLGV
jgi:5-methyltetrahydropteroyltriglutamate--homocysteine methyltransferase